MWRMTPFTYRDMYLTTNWHLTFYQMNNYARIWLMLTNSDAMMKQGLADGTTALALRMRLLNECQVPGTTDHGQFPSKTGSHDINCNMPASTRHKKSNCCCYWNVLILLVMILPTIILGLYKPKKHLTKNWGASSTSFFTSYVCTTTKSLFVEWDNT